MILTLRAICVKLAGVEPKLTAYLTFASVDSLKVGILLSNQDTKERDISLQLSLTDSLEKLRRVSIQETLFIDSIAIVLSEHLVNNFTAAFCVKILQVFLYVVSKMAHTPKLDTVGRPFS